MERSNDRLEIGPMNIRPRKLVRLVVLLQWNGSRAVLDVERLAHRADVVDD